MNKFLACGDLSKAFISYRCHICNFQHKMKLTYKSRLCNSCGYNYSIKWTNSITNQLINIPHRHVLFTIPQQFRKFIAYDKTILSKLAADINNIFKYQFHNIHDKKKRKIYIPKSNNKFFTDSDVIYIVSLGGLNKNFIFKKLNYFHVNSIANQWRYVVYRALSQANYPNDTIKKNALDMASKMIKEDVRFFFNVGDNDVNNPKGIIQYLGRYLARVPIAEYKIVDINLNKNIVTFMFNDLANNKEITYKTLTIQDFVAKLLFHLPYKHFKMINRFGFYARRKSNKLDFTLT
nr:transposase [Streptobacillus canis]